MTRRELATAVGGLMIGTGCSATAEKLMLPAAVAAEHLPPVVVITSIHVNLAAAGTQRVPLNECTIGLSPNFGWTFTIYDPLVVDVTFTNNNNYVKLTRKGSGSTIVLFFYNGKGALKVLANCE
jgi:hypothetical protein